jgi:glycyl-tRNA synthetase
VFEVIGLAYRTDYDLKKHSEKSGAKLQINQPGKGNIVPHVIEPSAGLSRLIYAVMLSSYVYGEPNSDRDWNWFNFTGAMAPWEAAILPLMKKDGMSEGAKELYWQLKDYGLEVIYDESGKIGKRYARNDEIGVKYCITYDYDSLEKDLITIRDRDTMHQVQIKIDLLPDLIRQLILDILTWSDLENEFGRFK